MISVILPEYKSCCSSQNEQDKKNKQALPHYPSMRTAHSLLAVLLWLRSPGRGQSAVLIDFFFLSRLMELTTIHPSFS